MSKIAVVNQSTVVTNEQAELMTRAVKYQVLKHVSQWYKVPASVTFYRTPSLVPKDAWVVVIVDDEKSSRGALGWYNEQQDQVFAMIMAKTTLDAGGVILYDPNNPLTVASVLSHEVLEMVGDADVNDWVDG